MVADIYNPLGQLVTTLSAGCSGGALNLALTNTGVYTILVHDSIYRLTGSYSLSFQSVTDGGCNSKPIVCGKSTIGNIVQRAQTDSYAIAVQSGTPLTFGFGGFPGIQFELYSPSGGKLFTKAAGSSTNVTLSAPGAYTL